MVFNETALFIGDEQGLYKPWGVDGELGVTVHLLAGVEVLGMLHSHKEK